MHSVTGFLKHAAVAAAVLVVVLPAIPAHAQEEFPFGF
jgi:hypothetical protein